MITYRTLLEAIQSLTEEQLDMTASIFDAGIEQVIPLYELKLASEMTDEFDDEITGVVEYNQPLMVVR